MPRVTEKPPEVEGHLRLWPVLLLHTGFFLCGIATALPGAVLPVFFKQWALTDAYAGALVATQFCTSALGATLVARYRPRTIKIGYGFAVLGFLLLTGGWRRVDFAAFAAIGIGIGLAMTSTSLMVSELYPGNRAAALSLLNVSWGIGAMSAPTLVKLSSEYWTLNRFFLTVAILFCAAWLVALKDLNPQHALSPIGPEVAKLSAMKFYFAFMLFLYVGTESSIGNWVTTLAERSSTNHTSLIAPYVASFFWGALLLGRAITPLVLKVIQETTLHIVSSVAAVISAALLLAVHDPHRIVAAAAWAGLALAPIFPLGLSALIARSPERSQLGWVFAFAGFGGASFTWLEGWLSTYTASLRSAFWAPVGRHHSPAADGSRLSETLAGALKRVALVPGFIFRNAGVC